MNRLFGSSSSKPKPSLTDAIASTDLRIDSIEVKVRKLDAELTKYRDQMRKMRDGPGKVRPPSLSRTRDPCARPSDVRPSLTPHSLTAPTERGPAARAARPQAEEAVRGPGRPAAAADVQHGAGLAHHRQPAQHDGHRRRYEDGQQGTQETVRQDRRRQDRGASLLSLPRQLVSSRRTRADPGNARFRLGLPAANAVRHGGPDRTGQRGARVHVTLVRRPGRARRNRPRRRSVRAASPLPFNRTSERTNASRRAQSSKPSGTTLPKSRSRPSRRTCATTPRRRATCPTLSTTRPCTPRCVFSTPLPLRPSLSLLLEPALESLCWEEWTLMRCG